MKIDKVRFGQQIKRAVAPNDSAFLDLMTNQHNAQQ